MELQYKQQTLQNNLMDASYASGGLQSHTWEFQWGPQGLEYATKRIGMNPVITQNFSTDPMGRILSMTYQGPTYSGELYFHYDVQGNTSLLTDSNGNGVASFRYDLHSGGLVEYWNPNNLELMNLELAEQGGIRIEVAARGELVIQPVMPPTLIEMWVPLHLRSGPGSLPPGHFLPPGMTIYEYWMMLYRMGLIDQMPEGGRYDDPFGGLTHQDPGESGGLRFYDPTRVYIHTSGRTWQNYRNCVINCFAGLRGRTGRNITNTPSRLHESQWEDWISRKRFKNIFGEMWNILEQLLLVLASWYLGYTLIAGHVFRVDNSQDFVRWIASGFGFMIGVHHGIELISLISDYFGNLWKEGQCRKYCNVYRPL